MAGCAAHQRVDERAHLPPQRKARSCQKLVNRSLRRDAAEVESQIRRTAVLSAGVADEAEPGIEVRGNAGLKSGRSGTWEVLPISRQVRVAAEDFTLREG